MMGMVTILDVARKAGVSPSTVTHTLNGKRPVGEETQKKVRDAISALGYIPNRSASNLRSGKSGIIGCYAADITESFANQLVRGVEQGIAGSGSSLLFASGVELGDNLDHVLKFFRTYDVDGLIICHHFTVDSSVSHVLSSSPIPVISLNKEVDGVPSIIPDNKSGGLQAAEHLVSSGMRRPAMLAGPAGRDSSMLRIEGFSARLEDLGLPLPSSLCLNGPYDYSHGYSGALEIFARDPSVDGIFCANDYIAAGAISAVLKTGRRIPEDVRVLGFDNRDFSTFWNIPISTFQQPLQEMGFMGVGILRSLIENCNGMDERCIKLQSRLIVRESTCHGAVSAPLPPV